MAEETDGRLLAETIRIRCERDFETFSNLFFPHYTGHPFNQFHVNSFDIYREVKRAVRRVDCAPRGYAKSAVKALFKPIHDICYRSQKYILFISATKSQALGKLKDIRAEILDNPFLSAIYGLRFEHSKPGSENFIVCNGDWQGYLHAVGAGTELRGIRFREARPTKIILDDVEDSEEIDNEELREKNSNWFFEVVSNLGSELTDIEIIGTILHKESLLMKLSRNPAYDCTIYRSVINWSEREDLWDQWRNIYTNLDNNQRVQESQEFYDQNEKEMLKGTKVLWPEKEPYLYLMKEMVEKGKRAFMKEKQNEPLSSTEALFDTFHYYREDKDRGGLVIESTEAFISYDELRAYGGIDPATGETRAKKKSKLDFTCIASGYHDNKGRLFVHRDWTKRERPRKYIQAIYDTNDEMQYEKFIVETNLFRNLLMENLRMERKRIEAERKKRGDENWGIKVPFYEVENKEKKEKRIFTLEPKVNYGWILFNRALSMDFMNMMEQFPQSDHDDAPDVLEMLWSLVNGRYRPSAINLDLMGSK